MHHRAISWTRSTVIPLFPFADIEGGFALTFLEHRVQSKITFSFYSFMSSVPNSLVVIFPSTTSLVS